MWAALLYQSRRLACASQPTTRIDADVGRICGLLGSNLCSVAGGSANEFKRRVRIRREVQATVCRSA